MGFERTGFARDSLRGRSEDDRQGPAEGDRQGATCQDALRPRDRQGRFLAGTRVVGARIWNLELMSDTYNYPAEIERDEDGRYVVAFPDFGWGATDGATRDEALTEARDLLRELIAATMRAGKNLPKPSRATKRRPLVVPPLPVALKAALYEAFREAGVSQRRLARDLDVAESEVRRMLNPDHATKAATIDRALRRLGKRVCLTVGEAA